MELWQQLCFARIIHDHRFGCGGFFWIDILSLHVHVPAIRSRPKEVKIPGFLEVLYADD